MKQILGTSQENGRTAWLRTPLRLRAHPPAGRGPSGSCGLRGRVPSSSSSRAPRWPSARRVTRPRALEGRSAAAGARPGDSAPPHPGLPSPESRVPGSRGLVRGDCDPAPPAPTPPPRRARRRALPLPCPVHGGARSDRSRRCRRSRRQRAGDDLGVAFGAGCRAGGLGA
ncbi:hypothetical protein J1605_015759 [Eschrichtius robustus]|uniref:Uncharacterized protein n=1 Tax=Eschrichtius robustus TaxID=9764 RepID=A0AB34GAM6_ESCRO|nr:hypothetical protein J1605_015759 [Eschrichtius robustus]